MSRKASSMHELKIAGGVGDAPRSVELDGVKIDGNVWNIGFDGNASGMKIAFNVVAGHPDQARLRLDLDAEALTLTATVLLSDAACNVLRALGPAGDGSTEAPKADPIHLPCSCDPGTHDPDCLVHGSTDG